MYLLNEWSESNYKKKKRIQVSYIRRHQCASLFENKTTGRLELNNY